MMNHRAIGLSVECWLANYVVTQLGVASILAGTPGARREVGTGMHIILGRGHGVFGRLMSPS